MSKPFLLFLFLRIKALTLRPEGTTNFRHIFTSPPKCYKTRNSLSIQLIKARCKYSLRILNFVMHYSSIAPEIFSALNNYCLTPSKLPLKIIAIDLWLSLRANWLTNSGANHLLCKKTFSSLFFTGIG